MSKSNVQSMTSGSPLRLILVFMIPLLLGNLFQQFYNIVDAMIVGRLLGADALAAVGSSSSVQFLVLGFCMGSCAGFGIPVSQRFGAEDMQGLRRYVYHSLVVTAIIAAVLTILTALLCPLIMRIMQTPEDIYQDAYQYLLIIFLGIQPSLDGLRIDPCIPDQLEHYTVDRLYRGSHYHITIDNHAHAEKGVSSMTVDGAPVAGNVIPLGLSGERHEVVVTLG